MNVLAVAQSRLVLLSEKAEGIPIPMIPPLEEKEEEEQDRVLALIPQEKAAITISQQAALLARLRVSATAPI